MRRLMVLSVVGVVGCDDDSKLPVGSTCGEPSECESGLCVENLCIDPLGCAEVLNPVTPGPLFDACLMGLSSIIVTPASVIAALGERVEFEVQGVFSPAAKVSAEEDVRDAALTATLDVTALVNWNAPDGVSFSSEEPGVAVIGEGTLEEFSVEAILRVGEGEMEGEALRYLRASATVRIERAAGGEP
jgi:hypothetical protein